MVQKNDALYIRERNDFVFIIAEESLSIAAVGSFETMQVVTPLFQVPYCQFTVQDVHAKIL